uniref:Ig-like domain-containing protein n=1 Tax=Labrus bergylta TaxID=56723 RepID=A0A3Q3LXR0_9LABR
MTCGKEATGSESSLVRPLGGPWPLYMGHNFLTFAGNTEMTTELRVVQEPTVSDQLRPGDLMSLQCSVLSDPDSKTCPGGHSVLWFRAGSHESRPDIIYTAGNRRDGCEERSASQKSCVHHFSKNISSSDAGTYYCAVDTCGPSNGLCELLCFSSLCSDFDGLCLYLCRVSLVFAFCLFVKIKSLVFVSAIWSHSLFFQELSVYGEFAPRFLKKALNIRMMVFNTVGVLYSQIWL